MPSIPTRDLVARRLAAHHLDDRRAADPASVVARMCAVQAQEHASALWAVGLRTHGVRQDDVERAADQGRILRTHILRPTWHLVSPADIRWMLTLTSPRVHLLNAVGYRELELDRATLQKARRVIVKALERTPALTRTELASALSRGGVVASGRRLAYLVMHEELDGVLCSGPRRGRQSTYALLGRRAPDARTLHRDEALPTLLRRYLEGHGPATLHDFSWWSGLTLADAREAAAALGREIETSDDARAGRVRPGPYVALRGASIRGSATRRTPRACLLPNFDEWFVGYRHRTTVAGDIPSMAALASSLVIDGVRAGSWQRTLSSAVVAIDVAPSRAMSPTEQRAIAGAASAHGDFLGLEVRLTVRAPSARTRRLPPAASRATSR